MVTTETHPVLGGYKYGNLALQVGGVSDFFKLFISSQNYVRFYKLICCDSV
jgi:hypothetical protein